MVNFPTRAMYKMLDASSFFVFFLFSPRVILGCLCSTNVMLLCLGSFIRKIQTLDQLKRRGFSLANGCFLCHEGKEMTNQLLLNCVATRVLWDPLFSLLGIPRVTPLSVWDTLLGWWGSVVRKA